jgi:hypothetical protein
MKPRQKIARKMAQFYSQVKLIFKRRSTKAAVVKIIDPNRSRDSFGATEACFFLDKNEPPLIYKKAKSFAVNPLMYRQG